MGSRLQIQDLQNAFSCAARIRTLETLTFEVSDRFAHRGVIHAARFFAQFSQHHPREAALPFRLLLTPHASCQFLNLET